MDSLEKLYTGTYHFTENKRNYSEESFEVFKNPLDQSTLFQSEILTRVANGEFLKIKVMYKFNKDFMPLNVVIDKTLGSQRIQEMFVVNSKEQKMEYLFVTDEKTHEEEINLPPKFHISTPAAVTSFAYFLSKKYDINGKNYYNIFNSKNVWEFTETPEAARVIVETPQNGASSIKINEKTLNCSQYNLYEENEDENAPRHPLSFYISKHLAIPYRILGQFGVKIEILNLKHLEKDNSAMY